MARAYNAPPAAPLLADIPPHAVRVYLMRTPTRVRAEAVSATGDTVWMSPAVDDPYHLNRLGRELRARLWTVDPLDSLCYHRPEEAPHG